MRILQRPLRGIGAATVDNCLQGCCRWWNGMAQLDELDKLRRIFAEKNRLFAGGEDVAKAGGGASGAGEVLEGGGLRRYPGGNGQHVRNPSVGCKAVMWANARL